MIGYSKKSATGGIPVFQGFPEPLPGGFALANTGLAAGTILPKGSLVVADEQGRTATVLAGGKAYANAGGTATAYQVAKGHTFKVGDNFAKVGIGAKAYPITSIDTTNAAYDTINVGTSIGAVTAGDQLYASSATGATSSALPAGVNGLLHEDVEVPASGLKASVSVIARGTAYARRLPLYDANVAALAGLKNIVFTQSS